MKHFALGAVLLASLTACGGGSSTSLSAGCSAAADGVRSFNKAMDADRAGAATPADTSKAYASSVKQLNTAALITPAGQLHDMLSTAAQDIEKSRTVKDAGLFDDGTDQAAAVKALDTAAPLCAGQS